jgi:hypothetical protein
MFLGLFVSGVECALMTIEAANVIAMRMPMIAKGDTRGQVEAELMIAEKFEAFAQAGADIMAGISSSIICENFRTVIQANEVRLNALRVAA